jgi:parallel beta-helix repeat protein
MAFMAVFVATVVVSGPTVAGAATPSCDVRVDPSQNVVRKVAAAGADATICFAPGDYRVRWPLRPRAGQTLLGWGHARLIGARRLSRFVPAGVHTWAAHVAGSPGPRTGDCRPGTHDACRLPNALFFDGRPLRRVMVRGMLGPGAFWFGPGDHRVYVHADPRGHDLEVAQTPAAIISRSGSAGADVTVRGLTVTMFATRAQHGAIDTSAPGWRIVNDRVELNHGAGITTQGDATISDVRAVRNGQEGIGGTGDHTLVSDCLIANNNWAGFDPGWEAGGAKWSVASDLTVRDNVVRDNRGPGLWTDIDSIDVTYEGNVVIGNERAGIFHEISGAAVITDNVVRGNGFGMGTWLWGSGILLAASHDVSVSANTVSNNANAIGLIQQDRGVSGRDGSPRVLHDIAISGNIVDIHTGSVGLVQDNGDASVFDDASITYTDNTYRDYSGTPFLWNDTEMGPNAWRALGHDVDGVFQP